MGRKKPDAGQAECGWAIGGLSKMKMAMLQLQVKKKLIFLLIGLRKSIKNLNLRDLTMAGKSQLNAIYLKMKKLSNVAPMIHHCTLKQTVDIFVRR